MTRHAVKSGPTPMAQAYWALWAQGQALLCLVYGLDPDDARWLAALSAALLPAALLGYLTRLVVQDWFTSARGAERAFIPMIVLGCFQMPFWLRDHHVLPEGFAFALFPLALFAFSHAGILWLWACSTLGSWFALAGWPDAPLGVPLALGALALWSLTAIHYASVGGPFGLRGWWPFRRVALTVCFFCLPGGLAAWLVSILRAPSSPEAAPAETLRADVPMDRVYERLQRLSRAELMELMIRAGLSALILLVAIVVLWLVRRWLGRKVKPQRAPILFGADISEAEFGRPAAAEPNPTLDGSRGEALALWRRWERALAQSGRSRAADETAAEFTRRIVGELGAAPDSLRIARLLESAHYAAEEPTASDLAAMRELVNSALTSEEARKRSIAEP